MADEVKRLAVGTALSVSVAETVFILIASDAALLQVVVDAARKRDHHELTCASLLVSYGTIETQRDACDCGFHETIDALEHIDARLAEKERK